MVLEKAKKRKVGRVVISLLDGMDRQFDDGRRTIREPGASEIIREGEPTYPPALFQKLASLTPQHDRAWDVGTGNGQAAITL